MPHTLHTNILSRMSIVLPCSLFSIVFMSIHSRFARTVTGSALSRAPASLPPLTACTCPLLPSPPLRRADSPADELTLHPTRACPSYTLTLAQTRSRSPVHTHYFVLCCPHPRHSTILAPQGGHTLPYHSTSHSPTRSRTPPRSPISFRYTSLVAPNTTSQCTQHTQRGRGAE